MLLFEIRGRRCALPRDSIEGVLPVAGLTSVPGAPSTVRGVLPWRGAVLPVLEIGPWLAPDDLQLLAFDVRLDDRAVAFSANPLPHLPPARAALSVDRVLRLENDDPMRRATPPGLDFIAGVNLLPDGPVWILDPAAILKRVHDAITALAVPRS